jgi:hypothetical protein
MSPTLRVAATLLLFAASPVAAQDAEPPTQRLELRSYQEVVAQHGDLGPLTAMPITATPLNEYTPASLERWGVFEVDGAQLDAFDFAERVGDTQLLSQLHADAQRSRTRGWLAAGVGVLAMGTCAGMVGVSARDGDIPDAVVAVGAGLGLGGLVSTAAGLRIAIRPRKLHGDVDQAWTQSSAQALIDRYNQALEPAPGGEGD